MITFSFPIQLGHRLPIASSDYLQIQLACAANQSDECDHRG
jgi:hypothetical protein